MRLSRTERAIIGAQGKVLIMLVSMLQARGQLELEEVSSMLGVFSVVVSEDSELEGDILALWAAMMKQIVHENVSPES